MENVPLRNDKQVFSLRSESCEDGAVGLTVGPRHDKTRSRRAVKCVLRWHGTGRCRFSHLTCDAFRDQLRLLKPRGGTRTDDKRSLCFPSASCSTATGSCSEWTRPRRLRVADEDVLLWWWWTANSPFSLRGHSRVI
ncbi:hypothetical protein F2P81_017652 [Scophthalmus maximus]|uniref:Uncharacterized protein n=1 Tax=Scophthalmus maximus TaxID=52904 RepID=A0A6A4SIG3_SCOMX|nr:hypothetical protein F2P81_017652 [Scophthalmus maximus]